MRFIFSGVLFFSLCGPLYAAEKPPAPPDAPTDEQIELAAIQNAMQACGAAGTYNIQSLLVYCKIANIGAPVATRLEEAIKSKTDAAVAKK